MQAGDVVVTLGAGDIWKAGKELARRIRITSPEGALRGRLHPALPVEGAT